MHTRIGRLVRIPAYLLLILCLVFVSLVPAANHSLNRALPVDLALRALLSQADRGTPVSVIVQTAAPSSETEALVRSLGGEVVRSWTIIPAFLANLSADAVVKLAQSGLVRWISWNSPLQDQESGQPEWVSTSNENVYNSVIGATSAWENGLKGKGIAVAVVDSGISYKTDFQASASSLTSRSRILANVTFGDTLRSVTNLSSTSVSDLFGHGTHIAGIIGSNGVSSSGSYRGVAPEVNLINLRVADLRGRAFESDMVDSLQWIYDNHKAYNIRVVNVSMNSATPQSYHTSPLNAALEILWFNGIVVVVSAGNNGGASATGIVPGIMYPPANDPFVITVGATDDKGTAYTWDDFVAPFSAYGFTEDGFQKPELVAPGAHIINLLASSDCTIAVEHPEAVLKNGFLRLSGTSMSAGVVSGAAALLLQAHPEMNPDQVKWALMNSATPLRQAGAGAGILNVWAAIKLLKWDSANIGITASKLLWTGDDAISWGSVNWGSVNWGSVNWGSVNWGSVNWGSVNWGSVNWGY
jgi:serine protease AprX